MWNGQTRMLGEIDDLRIVAYDLRGHGNSDVGDGQYSIDLFVDDLIGLLDHLGIAKTILCGFSMGGYIELRGIERNPDRFSALVLCDTQSAADSNEAKIRRANSVKLVKKDGVKTLAEGFLKGVFALQTFETRPEVIDRGRQMILSNSPVGICGALLAMAARTDTTEMLSRISVPALVLVGEVDKVTPPSAAKSMQEKIANARLHVIENAAHMSNLENPVMFNQRLAEFVTQLPH
jgi:3-oxoadipate enol-lactonase